LDCRGCAAQEVKVSCPVTCMAPTCTSGSSGNGGLQINGQTCTARCSGAFGGQRYCGRGGVYDEAESVDCSKCQKALSHINGTTDESTQELEEEEEEKLSAEEEVEAACEDDSIWVDRDGNGCDVYKNTLKVWARKRTCEEFHNGMGGMHCRATCGTCEKFDAQGRAHQRSDVCVDNACIGPWKEKYGRCLQCHDFPKGCTDEETREVFLAECPLTCGVCKTASAAPISEEVVHERGQIESSSECKDEPGDYCTVHQHYCANPAFQKSCPKTCNLCAPAGIKAEPCADIYSTFTCSRYKSYGWCEREDTKDSIRLQCPATCGVCNPYKDSKGEVKPWEKPRYDPPLPTYRPQEGRLEKRSRATISTHEDSLAAPHAALWASLLACLAAVSVV